MGLSVLDVFGFELFQSFFGLVAVGLRHVAADHADGGIEHCHVIGKAKAQNEIRNDIEGHDEIGKGCQQNAFRLEGGGGINGAVEGCEHIFGKGNAGQGFFEFWPEIPGNRGFRG